MATKSVAWNVFYKRKREGKVWVCSLLGRNRLEESELFAFGETLQASYWTLSAWCLCLLAQTALKNLSLQTTFAQSLPETSRYLGKPQNSMKGSKSLAQVGELPSWNMSHSCSFHLYPITQVSLDSNINSKWNFNRISGFPHQIQKNSRVSLDMGLKTMTAQENSKHRQWILLCHRPYRSVTE